MQSKPENNPTSSLETSVPERTHSKKVLLFAVDDECGQMLIREIKKSDHLVVETVNDLGELIHEIAKTTPHLIVAHMPDKSAPPTLIPDFVHAFVPTLPVCLAWGDLSQNPSVWQEGLREILSRPIKPEVPRPYAEGPRYIIHDESLRMLSKGKLNHPKREVGWEKVCSGQESRFVMQLLAGRKNHEAAKHYFNCLTLQQEGLDQELAYRLVHGSYKALSWSRDLACKWLALLAHYIPDTDLEHLPKAGTPGPAIDFVHHDAPLEGVYAATLLILHKIKPALVEAIKQSITARFDGQDDDTLLATSLHLYGMAKMLQQVGAAQIELMNAWLDSSVIKCADDAEIPRSEHRNAGIYRDFYDLGFVINSPEPLNSILKEFHDGTTYFQQERFAPSFAEFRRLYRGGELLSEHLKDE